MHKLVIIAAAASAQFHAPPLRAGNGPAIVAARPPLALDLSGLRGVRPTLLEATRVSSNATDVPSTTYIVRTNDTVQRVGEATGVGGNAIIRANALQPPYGLRPGQSLLVPGGRYHRVGPGETGIAIARAYGIPWSRIVDANGLTGSFSVRVGQRLVLPGATRANQSAQSLEARAATFRISIDDLLTGSETARVAHWSPPRAVVAPPTSGQSLGAASQPFTWPAAGAIVARFGSQGRGRVNQGVDIAVAPGTGVRATAPGEVAYVGNGVPGYGGLILVRHDDGWFSAYGRVDSAAVGKGVRVAAGQTIGRTGSDTLHFELRRARIAVDPLRYLPGRS